MNLLIVTQKVDKNDPILGFFHRWLVEFAKHCEKLTVICLFEGEHDLPKNVKVLSLGKEQQQRSVLEEERSDGKGRSLVVGSTVIPASTVIASPKGVAIQSFSFKLKYILNFWKYIYHERKNYDTVLVHMNPIYFVLGGIFWKLAGKKTSLWYTHRNVDWKLRIAEKFADVIFTASKESFQLKSEKVKVIGHGIPVEEFKNPLVIASTADEVGLPLGSPTSSPVIPAHIVIASPKGVAIQEPRQSRKNITNTDWMPGGKLRIISVGRLTPIKNLDTLIESANILKNSGIDFRITLVGGTMNESDKKYLEKLKEMIKKFGLEDKIIFTGGIEYNKIKEYYWNSDISVNLCPTGGVDKAVLESMSAGLPVLVSNEAFRAYFGKYGDMPIFKERDPKDLADKIMKLAKSDKIAEIKEYLFEEVKNRASLESLIKNIIVELK